MRTFRFPLFAIGLLVLVIAGFTPLRAKAPEGWLLAFDDEFDGKTLDTTKWGTTMAFVGTKGPRYHNDFYLSYTLDENVLFSDGHHLRLRTDRRTITGTEPAGSFDYTQGLISSDGKFSFTYGYIEIRAKYPGGKGLWPCFWLMPQNQLWPPEFDIAEFYAGRQKMHFGLAHGTIKETMWDSNTDSSIGLEGEWHTYALEWTAGRAVWSVDGVPRKTVEAEYVPNCPMFIILSNSVSSRFGPSGVPDEKTVFPNDFEVEYVRVYQPQTGGAATVLATPAAAETLTATKTSAALGTLAAPALTLGADLKAAGSRFSLAPPAVLALPVATVTLVELKAEEKAAGSRSDLTGAVVTVALKAEPPSAAASQEKAAP